MYTGKTEQPCCLCGDPETVSRLDLPPRTIQCMKHAGSIAWRDIVGNVSIHFCADDWDLVTDLVGMGLNPLSRCNAGRASLDIREDFEALLNDVCDEPDHTEAEATAIADARETVETYDEDDLIEERDLVEAKIVLWSFDELGVPMPA